MQQRTNLGSLNPPAEAEEKKHLPGDDFYPIIPFPKFSKDGFWRLRRDPNRVIILKNELLAADILPEGDRYCIKRLLVLAINEKFYNVFLTRTTIHKNNFPFKFTVRLENRRLMKAMASLDEDNQDSSILSIQNQISSVLKKLDGDGDGDRVKWNGQILDDDEVLESIWDGVVFNQYVKTKKVDRVNITEVLLEEIFYFTSLEVTPKAEAFLKKQNVDFQNALLEFGWEGSREMILKTFSIFNDLFGVDKLEALISTVDKSDSEYSLRMKYAITINTLLQISTNLFSRPGGICFLTGAANCCKYIISEEGNIFFLLNFPAKGLRQTYKALHLNSGAHKAVKMYPFNNKFNSKFSIIAPILFERPPYFIPPPSCDHCINPHTGELNEILISDLLAGDASRAQFKPVRVLHIMTQVLKGLSYLHAKGLIHGDVHPGNFLLKDNDDVCINDFDFTVRIGDRIRAWNPGFSARVEMEQNPKYKFDENGWSLPLSENDPDANEEEEWLPPRAYPKMDSFGLGISIYQLLIGKNYCDDKPISTLTYEEVLFGNLNDERKLFGTRSQEEINQQIEKAIIAIPNLYKDEKDSFIAAELLRLCKFLIVSDQNKRLSCTEILPSFLSLQVRVNNRSNLSPKSNLSLRFFPVAEHFQGLPSRLQQTIVDEGIEILQKATGQISLQRLNL